MALRAGRFSVNGRLQNASNSTPSLKQGEKGDAVAIVQQALVDLGFAMPLTTRNGLTLPDGIFGAETTRVVKRFQSKFGLVVDGVVGRQTMAKLDGLLVAVLDPDVVVRIDEVAARPSAPREIRGARNWAKGAIAFSRQLAGAVQPMLVNGEVGLVLATHGQVLRLLRFSFAGGRIATADIIADPDRLSEIDLAVL